MQDFGAVPHRSVIEIPAGKRPRPDRAAYAQYPTLHLRNGTLGRRQVRLEEGGNPSARRLPSMNNVVIFVDLKLAI